MPRNDYFHDQFIEDESQKESESDIIAVAGDNLRQAVVTGTDWTTETIITQINKGNILLNPAFQRRDAWTKHRKSRFIESLFLGFPVPQLVLAENKRKRGQYIVLDGKQRLLSIRQFAAPEDDPVYDQLKLSGLSVRSELNGKCLDNFRAELNLYDDLAMFENQPIRTVIIKNWPSESFLYHVFLRLNTGSVSLSPQELRQALHPGPFVTFVDNCSRDSLAMRDILQSPDPDFRMRDAELLVRYYAFAYFLPQYTGNLKAFLDDTCSQLNEAWATEEHRVRRDLNEFELAHRAIRHVFGDDSYRKWTGDLFETRFNRAVFDLLMFVFREPAIREVLVRNSQDVVNIFKDLCQNDAGFRSSIEQTTKSIGATNIRLSHWCERLNRSFNLRLSVPRLS